MGPKEFERRARVRLSRLREQALEATGRERTEAIREMSQLRQAVKNHRELTEILVRLLARTKEQEAARKAARMERIRQMAEEYSEPIDVDVKPSSNQTAQGTGVSEGNISTDRPITTVMVDELPKDEGKVKHGSDNGLSGFSGIGGKLKIEPSLALALTLLLVILLLNAALVPIQPFGLTRLALLGKSIAGEVVMDT